MSRHVERSDNNCPACVVKLRFRNFACIAADVFYKIIDVGASMEQRPAMVL